MDIYPLAYSVAEAVKVSGIARSSLYLALQNGSLRARKLGRRTIIEADELRRFLTSLPMKEVFEKKPFDDAEKLQSASDNDATV